MSKRYRRPRGDRRLPRYWLAALVSLAALLVMPAAAAAGAAPGAGITLTSAPMLENGGCGGVIRPWRDAVLVAIHWTGSASPGADLGSCTPLLPRLATYLPAAFADRAPEPEVVTAVAAEQAAPARREPPVWDGVSRVAGVPILMYHHVGPLPPGADSIRRGLTVSEAAFREQMGYLKEAGYQTVTIAQVVEYLAGGPSLPEKPVVITLDDGYRDVYEVALPVLHEHDFVASFFLLTAPIDEGNPEFVTWDQVREMHDLGMEMGAHSYTHPDLRGKTTDYVVWQVLGSKEAIEERTGEPVRVFAYPSGAYDEHAMRVVRSAQFWAALSTEPGCRHSWSGLWALGRVRIQPHETLGSFAEKLEACLAP